MTLAVVKGAEQGSASRQALNVVPSQKDEPEGPLTIDERVERMNGYTREEAEGERQEMKGKRWRVEAKINQGRCLIEDKAALTHGEWLPYLERVGMGRRSAQYLMEVARNPQTSNAQNSAHFPASLDALVALAQADPDNLEQGIKDGTVNPEMTIEEARAFARGGSQVQIVPSKPKPEPELEPCPPGWKRLPSGKVRPPGLHELPEEEQERIKNEWYPGHPDPLAHNRMWALMTDEERAEHREKYPLKVVERDSGLTTEDALGWLEDGMNWVEHVQDEGKFSDDMEERLNKIIERCNEAKERIKK